MKRRDFIKTTATGLAGVAAINNASAMAGSRTKTEGLRDLAKRHKLLVGTAYANWAATDPRYAETVAREFNCIVGENNMKMEAVQAVRGVFDFSRPEKMMAFAKQHKMKVRAIPLVWHDGLPEWAVNKTFPRQEAIDILREHVQTVTRQFRGRVFAWDVANEALDDKGTWHDSIGPEYLDMCYQWAHEIDPKCELFYNDFWIEGKTPRADKCYEFLKELLKRGVPIHGLGLQYHTQAKTASSRAEVTENIKRFMDLGLKIHITELDVWVPKNPTEEDFKIQADVYRSVFEMALELKIPAVVMWGFTDRHSWVPATTGGQFVDAMPFDREYQPKPAYHAIAAALREG